MPSFSIILFSKAFIQLENMNDLLIILNFLITKIRNTHLQNKVSWLNYIVETLSIFTLVKSIL